MTNRPAQVPGGVVYSGGPSPTLMSAKQIAALAGVVPATVWHWNKHLETFPTPLKISHRCTRWVTSEIETWFAERRDA